MTLERQNLRIQSLGFRTPGVVVALVCVCRKKTKDEMSKFFLDFLTLIFVERLFLLPSCQRSFGQLTFKCDADC